MTQGELAERLGVRRATLVAWERDKAEPGLHNLEGLAGALNVSWQELLADVDRPARRGGGLAGGGASTQEIARAEYAFRFATLPGILPDTFTMKDREQAGEGMMELDRLSDAAREHFRSLFTSWVNDNALLRERLNDQSKDNGPTDS